MFNKLLGFMFICGAGNQNQGLVHARQALYTPAPEKNLLNVGSTEDSLNKEH